MQDAAVKTAIRVPLPPPSFDTLLERVQAMRPALSSVAAQTEAGGRVPAATMQLLREAEIFRLVKPAAYGGFEYGPAEAALMGFELGRGCGSTGWCGSLAIFFHLMMAYFPAEAQRAVWSSEDDLLAVSYVPSRNCEIVDGGFRISGEWPYSSNCDNAAWIMVAAAIPAKEGPPSLAWMLVPAKAFEIDHASWNVAGLQGTGSKIVRIKSPTFVPDPFALRVGDVMAGSTPGAKIPGNILAQFRFPTFGPTCLVAPILGMAQGALDAFVENARTRVRQAKPGVINAVAASPMLQSRIGRASAAIESAKVLLVGSLRDAERKVRNGGQPDIAERIAIRRNQGYAASQAVAVVNDLYGHNGTAGTSSSASLQRFWRDANAAALHASLDWEAISAMYGQRELGLEPVGIF